VFVQFMVNFWQKMFENGSVFVFSIMFFRYHFLKFDDCKRFVFMEIRMSAS